MRSIKFTKMAASGNDFIVIDNRKGIFPKKNKDIIIRLCALHTGIGADGILLLEKSKNANFKMRIFNPDGSEPDMCGNGARCIGLYAWINKIIPVKFAIETLAGIIKAEIVSKDRIKIYLGKPKDIRQNLMANIGGKLLKIHAINTGVPHAIIYVRNIKKTDAEKTGKLVRWSPIFRPEGANVDFVEIRGKNRISIRTYERGVEGETLACGTGATASAIMTVLFNKVMSPVSIETKSGDTLIVDTEEISLTGPARVVFIGKLTN